MSKSIITWDDVIRRQDRIAATHRALGRFIEEARSEITAHERYYIGWRSHATGIQGKLGVSTFSEEDAKQQIERLNEALPDIEHYLIPAERKEEGFCIMEIVILSLACLILVAVAVLATRDRQAALQALDAANTAFRARAKVERENWYRKGYDQAEKDALE